MNRLNQLLIAVLPGLLFSLLFLLPLNEAFSQELSLNNAKDQNSISSPRTVFATDKISSKTDDLFGTKTRFVKNIGQYGDTLPKYGYMGRILFGYEGLGMPVLFTEHGLIHVQQKTEGPSEEEREKKERKEKTEGRKEQEEEKKVELINRAISMEWLNANPHPQIIMEQPTAGYLTYGSLQEKTTGYKKITYKELYPGIDVVYSFNPDKKDGFEYRLLVKPGADLGAVKMRYGGDIKSIRKDLSGNLVIKSDIDGIKESVPVSFYGDESDADVNTAKKINSRFTIKDREVSFELPKNYDRNKPIVIDPFVTGTGNLTGTNNGKAKDIDFDYNGNIYVTGGGDGTSHKMAKYDANGVLQWTFSGTLLNPSWSFGTYYGGWVVEKTTGNIYLGQGFEYIDGFSIIRLNTTGLYDNYISTANPNFREDWKMFWSCNGGFPQIIIAGGGTNSNINLGVCSPPSTTISSLNITGIAYTGTSGWAQDISDIVIDPVTSDLYSIYGSLYGTPSLSNQIYKNTAPYSSASVAWKTSSGFTTIQEIANRPYLLTPEIDNSSNVFAINSSYLFFWDGKNLKAFDKATGNGAGTPLTIASATSLMTGGIIADECNNIFIGSTNGTIKVYKFDGSTFNDAAAPDITVSGFTSNSVYDLAYNEAQKILYASGDGFVASFDISSYGCPNTSYTLSVVPNCSTASATVTISPTPPSGSTVTYNLYSGSTFIISNSTGVFTGISPNITYTVKATINQACSGTQATVDFVLPGPVLSITKVDATCGSNTGTITASGSGGTAPYTFSKDGITFLSSGSFTGLASGLYTITVKDANGCKNTVVVNILNSNGPAVTFTKTDATCVNNNGSITATGSGGTAPYQYSIDGTTFQSNNFFTGLIGGQYTLTVKDVNSCTNVVSVNINSLAGPQLTAIPASTTCNNNNGSITVLATGGTAPLQYSINANIFQSSNIFSNLAAGAYTVTVKDANGCINTFNVSVNNSPGPTVTAVASTASCNNVNGSITATGTGGVSPLQYSINGVFFQSNNIFTGLAAGSYTVTVKDANGCTNTTTVTVNNSNGPTLSAISTAASCSTSNGTITVTATGTSPFQYSINAFTFQGSNIFTGLATGNYIVYVKDALGCIATTTVTVNNTVAPQITVVETAASCTVNNGTITATGTGGTGLLQYSIDGTTFNSSNVFNGLSTGNYTVTVKDVNGCTNTTIVFIDNADGLHLTASSISTNCSANNGSITATASGGVGTLQYSIDGTIFQSSNIFTGIASANYTVTVKDANGCIANATVFVDASSSVQVMAIAGNSCSNKDGTITASGSGGTPPLSYSINGTTFQSSGFFYGLTPGTYTITVRDATGCSSAATVTIINVTGTGPTINAKFHDAESCTGDGPFGRIDNIVAAGGTAPYTFSLDGGPFINTTQFLNVPVGVHTVTVKDANGCTNTIKGTIADPGAPTVTATSVPTPCGLSTGTITAKGQGGSPPYTYSLNGGPFKSSGTFTGLSAGTYTIIVQDDNGCFGTVDVIVLNTGGPTLTTSHTDGSCGLNNGTITAKGSGGTGTLTYNINGGVYQNSGLFTGLSAGTYTITVRDGSACTGGATITVLNPGAPVLSLTTNGASCNTNNGSITANVTGGTLPAKYSIDGTIFQSSNTFNNLSPGTYTITVLDVNNCFSKAAIAVLKIAIPQVSAYTVAAACNSTDGSITATGSNGTTPYEYSINGTVFQSSNIFTSLAAGFYTVMIKDANGCSNTTGVTVSNSSGLQLSLTAVSTTCGNSNGVITATGTGDTGLLYSLDGITFQSNNIFNGLAAGSYTVTVKDVNGCINAKAVLVGNINGPQLLTVKVVNTTCANNNGSIIATATGGAAPLQYSINGTTFQASNIFSSLAAGPYTVIVKDANGCTKTITPSILNLAGPLLSVTSANASCNKSDGSITVTANGGTSPLQYSINGVTFQLSNIFTKLAAGPYTVTVKDANGCTGTIPVTINSAIGSSLTASAMPSTCGSSNGSITANATGGTPPLQYSIDGTNFQLSNIFTGLTAAAYTVTVKDANGCTGNSISLSVGSTNSISVNAGVDISICEGTPTQLKAETTGSDFSWFPTDGLSNPSILNPLTSPQNTTTYILTATSGACMQKDTVTVFVNPAPVPDAGNDASVCLGNNVQLKGSNGTKYSWAPPTFLSSTRVASPVVIKPTENITYTLSITDANGCNSLTPAIVHITVKPAVQIFAGRDTSIAINQPLQLNAVDIGNNSFTGYSWLPASGLDNPYIQNPIAVLNNDIVYTVTARTSDDCEAHDNIVVRVYRDADIFVPTGFTPNGDGLNDVAKAIPVGIKEFKYFTIYNRFGQMVFTTSNPSIAWDGTYAGKRQGSAAFVWKVEGIDYKGNRIFKKGTLVLIR